MVALFLECFKSPFCFRIAVVAQPGRTLGPGGMVCFAGIPHCFMEAAMKRRGKTGMKISFTSILQRFSPIEQIYIPRHFEGGPVQTQGFGIARPEPMA